MGSPWRGQGYGGVCGLRQPQQMVLDQILESGQRGRLAMRSRPCLRDNSPVWTSGSSSGSSARRIALCPSQTAGTLELWQTAVLKPCDNLGKPNSETCFLLWFIFLQEFVSPYLGCTWFDLKWLCNCYRCQFCLVKIITLITKILLSWIWRKSYPFISITHISIVAMSGRKKNH